METYSSWRELLSDVIQDIQERQRIANELGVNIITLSRWVHGSSNPRPQYLRRLLTILPRHRALLYELILREDADFSVTLGSVAESDENDEIPVDFYAHIFNTYVIAPHAQRSWLLTDLILQRALSQLDPHHVGMSVTIVQCMPPSIDGKVSSLRERTGYGTSPWNSNLEPYAVFLGAESLAGYVVSSCYPRVLQNSNEHQGIIPAHWVEFEKSAAVYPISRAGKVAGCVIVSCAEPNYFVAARQSLIQHYAELLVLVFEPDEFYDLGQVNLHVMPHYQVQMEVLANFRQRVSDYMTSELRLGHSIDLKKAETVVWQQLEHELLLLPLTVDGRYVPTSEKRASNHGAGSQKPAP